MSTLALNNLWEFILGQDLSASKISKQRNQFSNITIISMDDIQKLLLSVQKYVDAAKQKQEEARQRGENFNIFEELNLATDETRCHSRFIAALLNPHGSHGCDKTFLQAFYEVVGNDSFVSNAQYRVETEVFIGNIGAEHSEGGRMDLVIFRENKKDIVIENKIYAGDQYNQLQRYHNDAPQAQLLYLTLDGHEPSENSKGQLANNQYQCISYQTHILTWLERCLHIAINKPLVRETIAQYIQLIKQLTHKDMQDYSELFNQMIQYPAASEAIYNHYCEFLWKAFKIIVEPQLQRFAKLKGYEYWVHDYPEKYTQFNFKRPKWKNSIRIETESFPNLFYIGYAVCGDKDVVNDRSQWKLLEGYASANNWWPYGSKTLDKYTNWNAQTIEAMKSGEYAKYIEEQVRELESLLVRNNII